MVLLVLNIRVFYVYKLFKSKVTITWITKLYTIVTRFVSHCSNVLYYLRGPLLVFPLGKMKGFQGVSFSVNYFSL